MGRVSCVTLDNNQQAELDHLIRCAQTHPNWIPYVTEKAEWKARKDPDRWAWLPAALDKAISTTGAETP